ncbi:MAG: aminoacyl-tRNA hydrolase [Clostridia bacterium]|nr:aminoacyl-tRNA hydrolase [Clostridia bacterium]
MIIVVGLGNPGEEYKNTYHNMGYKTVDALADKLSVKIKRAECSSLTAAVTLSGVRIVLARPVTYMNLSGQAVKSLLSKYKADIGDLIVIYDDIDLPRFSLRARSGGSGGTHNGMKNIIDVLSDTNFKRIRIGVGRENGELKDYVLSGIRKTDEKTFAQCFEKAADAVIAYAGNGDFEKLMRELNGRESNEVQ